MSFDLQQVLSELNVTIPVKISAVGSEHHLPCKRREARILSQRLSQTLDTQLACNDTVTVETR